MSRSHPSSLTGRLQALDDRQRCRLASRLGLSAAPGHRETRAQLAAYVTLRSEAGTRSTELQTFLTDRLPAYMVPAFYEMCETLPRNANGKVDRRALPLPGPLRSPPSANQVQAEAKPRPDPPEALSENERVLRRIWSQVLRRENVDREDNFFQLGGDSILTIGVIAELRKAGYEVTPRQMFRHQSIATLAPNLSRRRPTRAGVSPRPGKPQAGLTPIQRWFFAVIPERRDHWNMAIDLVLSRTPSVDHLAEAFAAIVEHHPALRLRFTETDTGIQARVTDKEPHEVFLRRSRRVRSPSDGDAATDNTVTAIQRSLDTTTGPLLRATLVDRGPGESALLSLAIHHLAVDAVSLQILLKDLETALQQREAGHAIQLPPSTAGYTEWAHWLQAQAADGEFEAERDYWTDISSQDAGVIPVDCEETTATVGSTRTVCVSLDADETEALTRDIPARGALEVEDLLIAAVVESLCEWTQSRTILLDIENHGRHPEACPLDLSRTVGWFTCLYPVRFTYDTRTTPNGHLKSIKERRRRVPGNGLGYGVLRYMGHPDDHQPAPSPWPEARVFFNYLGRLDAFTESTLFLAVAPVDETRCRDSRCPRTHLIGISAYILEGRLRIVWDYSKDLHREATIRRLAKNGLQALRTQLHACKDGDRPAYTPADFPDAGLEQDELDRLLDSLEAGGE